jgi:hypothetical protein
VSKPVVIGSHELTKIKDTALRTFHETRFLPEDSKDTQVFLVLKGFHSYLISLGITPQFEVKPVREENDTTPIDDL